jgi:fibronectin type 3 domain-containing protein
MRKLLFFILIAFSSLLMKAQLSNQPVKNSTYSPKKLKPSMDTMAHNRNLHVIARFYGDSVVLRWAPSDPALWDFANKAGYMIVRMEVKNKKVNTSSREVLSTMPIKPWTLKEWKLRANRNDSLAAACAELLYGKSKVEIQQKGKNKGINLNEALNKNYELQNKHGLVLFLADQSAFLAQGLGLRFTDKNIIKGKTYAYAVYALTDPKIVKSDTSGVLINTAETYTIPEMPNVTIEELDRKVKFTWNRQMASMYFSGYYYERSEDGGKTFKQLNKRPYNQLTNEKAPTSKTTMELNDSLPKNYKRYYYRITGITPFGDKGKPTPTLLVMGRDRIPPSPPIKISAKNLKDNAVKIIWTKKIIEPDFIGYLIGRSDKASGPFVPLTLQPLPVNTSEYIDKEAIPHGTNYYIVSAIDTAGNAGSSIPAYVIMTDTIPPAKPTGLSGKIDTSGIVHIKWRLGKEPDLFGYMVYYANNAGHTFTPVSKDFLVDTTFTDSITLKTLTKNIYYKVVAFDKNRNPSIFSDALELKRPDKVPPVTPVFNDFFVTDTSVTLRWANSSSNDVVLQILYRREKGKTWEQYVKLERIANSYVDYKVRKQTWYEYSIEAIDDAGLHSQKSFPLNVRVYDSGKRPKIQNFIVKKTIDGKSLTLSWKYPEKGNFWFVLYRSVDGKDLMTYKNIPSGQLSFTDDGIKKGTYQYSIKAVYKNGSESQKLNSTKINFVPTVK